MSAFAPLSCRRYSLLVVAALVVGVAPAPELRAQETDATQRAADPPPAEPPAAEAARGTTSAAGPDSVVGASGMTPEELDALTARVAEQLRCPVCRNQSVLESSASLSQEMQAEIRRQLASGASPEEVKAHFVDSYGEWILLQPRAEGLNLLVYVLPAVALLLGGFVVWRLLLGWSGASAVDEDPLPEGSPEADSGDSPEEGLDPEEEERLEAALRGDAEGTGR